MSKRKTRIDLLKTVDHDHLLMMEVMDFNLRNDPRPQNLVGQFILTYQLFPPNQLGYPISGDRLNEQFAKFILPFGFTEYDRRTVFSVFKYWGVFCIRHVVAKRDSKFYMINPLHKLDE